MDFSISNEYVILLSALSFYQKYRFTCGCSVSFCPRLMSQLVKICNGRFDVLPLSCALKGNQYIFLCFLWLSKNLQRLQQVFSQTIQITLNLCNLRVAASWSKISINSCLCGARLCGESQNRHISLSLAFWSTGFSGKMELSSSKLCS